MRGGAAFGDRDRWRADHQPGQIRFVGRRPFHGFDLFRQRMGQHFADMFDRDDLQRAFDVVRDFREIFVVLLRDQHRFHAAAQGREEFLLKAANGQHASAQCHLARHRNIIAHGNIRQHRDNRRDHADARGRAVLRRRAFGHMDMNIR